MHLRVPPKGSRVAVGLSGGVDSSLALRLLHEQGYDVFGLTMAIWADDYDLEDSGKHACFGPGEQEDLAIARELCRELGVPFYEVDLRAEYRQVVLDYFRREYLAGRTPNPCVVCNHRLKFGFLLERARAQGVHFDFFATGHYARIVAHEGRSRLARAAHRPKDQSYFLWGLDPDLLGRLYFPLGGMTKDETRNLARHFGLAVAERPESQDFIDGGDYAPLFKPEEVRPGEIVDEAGNVLGYHRGIVHYTIGQRKGLGIASPHPWFVLRLDARANRVVVTRDQGLFSEVVITESLHLHDPSSFEDGMAVEACPRLTRQGVPARIYRMEDGRGKLVFEQPQRAVAPGQSLVLYRDDLVVGGGVIEGTL